MARTQPSPSSRDQGEDDGGREAQQRRPGGAHGGFQFTVCSGKRMQCPACQTENTPDRLVCFTCGLAFSPPVKKGTVIGGRYEILRPLGQGGMGTLYRAMELIEGTDLRSLLRMRKEGLPPEQAFDLAVQLAGGLQALHDAGIVHRDVKAANVILDEKGRPRLMDFDFAKRHDAGAPDTAPVTGHILGTPEYMSPEAARGDPVEFRSDVYSLGVVVFEMFTGDVPFRGDSPLATILKHLNEPPPLEGPRAKGLPSSLLPVLRKALAKWSAERYSTAGGFAMALGFARIAFGELAPPPKVPTPPLPALLEALNPLDKTIRMQAVKARSLDTRSMRAIPALIDALEKPPAPSVVEPS